jgi:hypothetical protein
MMALCTNMHGGGPWFRHGHKSHLGLGILIVRGRWSSLENQCDTLSFDICSTVVGRTSLSGSTSPSRLMVGIIIRIH